MEVYFDKCILNVANSSLRKICSNYTTSVGLFSLPPATYKSKKALCKFVNYNTPKTAYSKYEEYYINAVILKPVKVAGIGFQMG